MFSITDCIINSVSFYCPILCGRCENSLPEVPKICQLEACENGGKLDLDSCKCECKHFFKFLPHKK